MPPTPCLSCLTRVSWGGLNELLKHHWLLSLLEKTALCCRLRGRTTRQPFDPSPRERPQELLSSGNVEESPILSTWPSHASPFSPEGLGFDLGMTSSKRDVTGPLFSPPAPPEVPQPPAFRPSWGILQLNIAVELQHNNIRNRRGARSGSQRKNLQPLVPCSSARLQ